MNKPSEEQIRLFKTVGSGFQYASEYWDSVKYVTIPLNIIPGATSTVNAGASFTVITTVTFASYYAVGPTPSATNSVKGGLCVSQVLTFTTGYNTYFTDDQGNVVNLVDVADAATGNPIITTGLGNPSDNGREVFGLWHVLTTTTDGASTATPTSSMISLVFFDSTNALQVYSWTAGGVLKYSAVKAWMRRYYPNRLRESSPPSIDVIDTSQQITIREGRYAVDAGGLPAVATLTINTGAVSPSGTVTSLKNYTLLVLPDNATDFENNPRVRVWRNGVLQDKGTGLDVGWNSSTAITINAPLSEGEIIQIETPATYDIP